MKIIITESQYNFLIENQEVVDRILDKIKEKGIKSLSIDEKRYLDEFSKHKGDPDEFIDPAERYDERRGEKFTSNFRNIPNITFTFDDEEIEDDQSILHGTIEYGDKSYWGVLIVNKLGHLIDLDFVDSDYNVLPSNDEVDRFQDHIEGMEHEVKMFFEVDVIPNLIELFIFNLLCLSKIILLMVFHYQQLSNLN
jgi:hypothetical protein